ncbi:hypothetical protein B0J13DRAFT_565944, partial [Dactylonectria estremocensis]
ETDYYNLTTVQALGIMSIQEASCGRDSESWYCVGQGFDSPLIWDYIAFRAKEMRMS